MSNDKTMPLVQALGTTAEMSLVFYRAALGAGATLEEAMRLTQAYIGALMFGKGQGQGKNEQQKEAKRNDG